MVDFAPDTRNLMVELFQHFINSVPFTKAVYIMEPESGNILVSVSRHDTSDLLDVPAVALVDTAFKRLSHEKLSTGMGTSILDTNSGRFVYLRLDTRIFCYVLDLDAIIDKILPYIYLTTEKARSIISGEEVELAIPSIEPLLEQSIDHDSFLELLSSKASFTFKAIVLGNQSVGKTSLIYRYSKGKFGFDMLPTIGVSITTHPVDIPLAKVNVNLQIWDLGGQKQFRKVRRNYYHGAHVAFMVFDVTNRESLLDLISWKDESREFTSENLISILVGNKNDLMSEREVSKDEAVAFAAKLNLPYLETSALTGINVNEIFKLAGFLVLNKEARKAGFGAK
ncbi:MAG: Rab family GTPase [Promethearchaeota archaeon]